MVIQNMVMLVVCLVFVSAALLHLAALLCTNVPDIANWMRYKGQGTARVVSVEKADVTVSRRMVKEMSGEKEFVPIEETLDKNVPYLPFTFRISKKYYPVLEWSCEGRTFRANYPYYRKKDEWKQGDAAELRYSVQKPWRYSVKDETLWRSTWLFCLTDMAIMAAGILIILSMVS